MEPRPRGRGFEKVEVVEGGRGPMRVARGSESEAECVGEGGGEVFLLRGEVRDKGGGEGDGVHEWRRWRWWERWGLRGDPERWRCFGFRRRPPSDSGDVLRLRHWRWCRL